MGIPLEGHIDSLNARLAEAEFTEWGRSDDGEDYYYRGKFYGIRAKLLVSISTQTHFVESAYITVGPYGTKPMFEKNFQYFLYKLQKDYGEFIKRDDAWYYMDDFGSVKMSEVQNENGSRDIRVFYYPSSAFYKDALTMGLHGPVQEIVTENAVAEDGSVGIRIPLPGFWRDLVARLGRPLVSTSANLSGEPTPKRFAEITEEIRAAVDYCVPASLERGSTGSASQIIKVGLGGEVEIIRP